MSRARVEQTPWTGFAYVGAAYLAALGAAWALAAQLPGLAPVWAFAVFELAATLVVFLFSRAANNTSVYDPYWSVAPMAQAAWLWAAAGFLAGSAPRATLVLVLVWAWGARLTWNWARGWAGLGHEDWRYDDFRKKTGRGYWLVSLTGLHLFPTLMTGVGGLALFPAMGSPAGHGLGLLDGLAALTVLGGLALETVADEQLRAFRRSGNGEGRVCDVGVWSWSRHPNYFGEWLFWLGLALFAQAGGGWWVAWLGPALMLGMFLFASIPLAEERSRARRPEWAAYAARTSRFVPLPPR